MAEISLISQALQLRGKAYSYPLVGDICVSLCSCVENLKKPENMVAIVVAAYTDGLCSVVGDIIEGDGSSVGQDVVAHLNELVHKALR